MKRPFSEDIVKCLEGLLEKAKAGHINFIAYAACEGPLQAYNGFSGVTDCFPMGYYQLQDCSLKIRERLNQLQVPERNLNPPSDMYAYDISTEPIGHDFIAWLVNVKMIQHREGVRGPTKICFLQSQNEQELGISDQEYRQEFFKSVMQPALELFDFTYDVAAKDGRRVNQYAYREITEAALRGEKVPRVQVPQETLDRVKKELGEPSPITITLREHRYHEHRNSQLKTWTKVAKWLEARGVRVVLIRDYAKADEPIEDFGSSPRASKDLMTRVAIYELAKLNLFVSNGCQTFALFGSKPWLMFVDVDEKERSGYLQNTPDWWKMHHGITKGEQFPWSSPEQKIIWNNPTFENIIEELSHYV